MTELRRFIAEALRAGRGTAGLIVGEPESVERFRRDGYGLAGSFIATLLVLMLGAALPALLGEPGNVLRLVAADTIIYAFQLGCTAIALRQAGRLDGLVPFLTADNWASAYMILIATALNLMGISDQFTGFALGVMTVLIAVNIGRVILQLEPLQVAMFVVAQVVGFLIGGLFAAPLLLPTLPAVSS